MMILKQIPLLGALLLISVFSFSQTSIEGFWKTIDDETGRIKSVVEITEREGQFYGTIVELFRLPEEDQKNTF